MIIYNTFENMAIKPLHNTFLAAFSDYQVKMDLPLLKFQQMLLRRGYIPKASIGAFNNNILVGFLLNGIRQWNGKSTAYDTGTGVVKSYRSHGITTNMFLNAKQLLKEIGVKQYLLEVIQSNTSAVSLYEKQGFEITRNFECYILDKNNFTSMPTYEVEHMNCINENSFEELTNFWDFKPSWQNSIDSINAVSDNFIYSIVKMDDIIVGYGIIDINTGDIPQIAVSKNYRCKGIGKSILVDLLSKTIPCNISILNIDSQCDSTRSFLVNLGFKQHVKQYEMVLKI